MTEKTEKKKAAKKPEAAPAAEEKPEGKEIGKITHVFDHISVGVLLVTDKAGIKVGDTLFIKAKSGGYFEQKVESLQVEHKQVDSMGKGEEAGIKTKKIPHEGPVYKK